MNNDEYAVVGASSRPHPPSTDNGSSLGVLPQSILQGWSWHLKLVSQTAPCNPWQTVVAMANTFTNHGFIHIMLCDALPDRVQGSGESSGPHRRHW